MSEPILAPTRLTLRGRRLKAASLALLLLLVGMASLRSCRADPDDRTSPAVPSPSSTPASASSRPTSSPSASSDAADDAPAGTDGIRRSGITGKGTWRNSTLTVEPPRKTVAVHDYVVRAEDGSGIDVDQAARQVSSILNDPRGWLGHQGNSFRLVTDPARAKFTIYLATPGTAQKMCPLDIRMTWSCRAGTKVILNTDRWLYMTPTFDDVDEYRAYQVNHEVGHFIGKGHLGCPKAGANAPVMMQQSKGLDGCRPNAWPSLDPK